MISVYSSDLTWLHKIRAGRKLLFLMLTSVFILPIKEVQILCCFLLFVIILYFSLGKSFWKKIILIRPIIPLLVIILLIQVWMGSFWDGIGIICRLVAMILLANLISISTRMTDIIAAIEPILKFFGIFGISSKYLSIAVALCIRFVTVFFQLWNDLDFAYRARTGKKGGLRLILPFIIQVMKVSEIVGDALTARGVRTND